MHKHKAVDLVRQFFFALNVKRNRFIAKFFLVALANGNIFRSHFSHFALFDFLHNLF